MLKVRQVRSDEQHGDTSKNLFSFGESFLLEECKQFGLINVSVFFERERHMTMLSREILSRISL